MKIKWIKFLILIILASFTIKTEGAESNEESNSEKKTYQAQVEALSEESLTVINLMTDSYQESFGAEVIIKLLLSYSVLMLKFVYFFNENVLHEQYIKLKDVIFHTNIQSTFIEKSIMIDNEKLECLYNSCFTLLKYTVINQLNQESNNNQLGFLMTIINQYDKILEPIQESQKLLKYLVSCDLNSTTRSMALTVNNIVTEIIILLENSINTYRNMNKKTFRKLFESRKESLNKANIDFAVSNQKLESLRMMKAKFGGNKQLITNNNDLDTGNCSEEEILEMELLVSISLKLLGLMIVNFFYFRKRILLAHLESVEKCILDTNEITTARATEMNVESSANLKIKEALMNKLEYTKIVELDNLSSKFSSKSSKLKIVGNIKKLYRYLLQIVLILKKELQLNKCGEYIQQLLVPAITIFENVGKDCVASTKIYEDKTELEILPFELIRAERECLMSRYKEVISDIIEKKKEKRKEEKEKLEKLESEQKLKLEKELLGYKAAREKHKKSKRQKKRFPEAQNDVTILQEKESSKISEVSQTSRKATKNKSERKKKLLEEIMKFEEDSLKKTQIRELVTSQKLDRISRKRKDKKKLRDKSNEGETGEPKDRNMNHDKPENNINQDSSSESSGNEETHLSVVAENEKERKEADINRHLLPVLKIVQDSVDKSAEGAFSISLPTKKTVKKRPANEELRSAPLVQSTLELFDPNPTFATRDRDQIGVLDRSSRSSFLVDTSEKSVNVLQHTKDLFDNKHGDDNNEKKARKTRSRTKNRKGSVGRASSESPKRNKSNQKLKTRSNSFPKTRTRIRSRSRTRRNKSKIDSKVQNKDRTYSNEDLNESFSVLLSKFMSLEKKLPQKEDCDFPVSGSRFIPMFSGEKLTKTQLGIDIFNFFNIKYLDFSHISENSPFDELENSIESCSKEILRINTEVVPLLTGEDLCQIKDYERSLIKQFIKLLIIFNAKKKELL